MGTYKMLTIDGGGIRGIIPATILVTLEKMIQKKTGSQKKIGDYFDFIAGTSTGGILSCIYLAPDKNDPGKARFTADDALSFYLKYGAEIFDRNIWKRIFSMGNLADEKYDAKVLESLLLNYFGDTKLNELIKPCLITGYDVNLYQPIFFTKHTADIASKNYFIRDVARATSAAPTFFEPALTKNFSVIPNPTPIIDGGVFANNPTACALVEAIKKGRPDGVNIDDIVILSLGTGSRQSTISFKECKDWGLAGWAKPLFGILMDGVSQTVDYQMKAIFKNIGNGNQYLRIQGNFNDSKNKLDIPGLHTDMDCATNENMKRIHQFGQQLCKNCTENLEKFTECFF